MERRFDHEDSNRFYSNRLGHYWLTSQTIVAQKPLAKNANIAVQIIEAQGQRRPDAPIFLEQSL
jgi:hypothetical protein